MHAHSHTSIRRGVVLLVVLSLLTLFAVVGLSFVMYANASAKSAQMEREAESSSRTGVDPELLFSYFLGQLIYDVPDDATGVFSALRGHSLARTMYGANSQGGNLVAYNGTGRLRQAKSPFGDVIGDHPLVNYTFYPTDPQLTGQNFLRDPERLGWRAADLAAPRGVYTGGFNAGYTYPDLNSMFLAAVSADGAVLLPSFHRPWTGDTPDTKGDYFRRDTNARNPLWEPNARLADIPAWYKYTTLRPLPALNPGFPATEDGGGDVKNLVGGPGTFRRMNNGTPEFWNNDSSWMDLGFPVLRTPDGRKYKPLFAALITDLDNRLNVNVHGNALGTNGEHRSNQGWGPWEVNLSKALGQPADEANRLVRGVAVNPPSPIWEGRYGPDRQPTSREAGNVARTTLRPHFYAQVDFDGRNENARATIRWELPPAGGQRGLRGWSPVFGPGFDNAGVGERTNHPLLFDPFSPTRKTGLDYDRTFAISNMEALLRYGDTGSPALTADLFRLCPTNFRATLARNLITTHSYDLDQAGSPPWLHDPNAAPYRMNEVVEGLPTPSGPSLPFRPLAERRPPFAGRTGEYSGTEWRSLISALGRINLSRPLPPYPHMGRGTTPPFGPPLTQNANGQIVLDMPYTVDAPAIWNQFQLAQAARQQLADDLYRRLLLVTGVAPIQTNPHAPDPTALRERRWLAQLAVNIVDYMDEDDVSTPFHFYTVADGPSPLFDPGRVDPARQEGLNGEIQWPLYWVFGTELPRVVLNEAMAQVGRNDPDDAYSDPREATVRVFVELHNTFPRQVPPGSYQPDSFPAPLRMGTGPSAYAPYRIVIGTKQHVRRASDVIQATIMPGEENDNVLGNPIFSVVRASTTNLDFTGLSASAPAAADPAYAPLTGHAVPAHGIDTETLPQGFFLVGPPVQAPAAEFVAHDAFQSLTPPTTVPLRSASLQYHRPFLDPEEDNPDERLLGTSVVLRRLANPYLPFDGRRAVGNQPNPTYNPYLTVDYLEGVPLTGVLERRDDDPVASLAKPQPYAAHQQLLEQQLARPHTFGRENATSVNRFDWLTHLDRPLTSPLELLSVSGCQPHQLTQQFISPTVGKHAHRAPWLDNASRLYRLFDFLEVGPQAAGVAAGSRIPGKININTIWDPEILRALADAQSSNHFTDADVDRLFTRFLYDTNQAGEPKRRTQGLMPSKNDQPFWSLGLGNFPAGDPQFHTLGGMDDTVLRLRHELPRTSDHPYLNAELLTKMFNHLTTRSNVFAVWLTVGFFEVTDENARPVKLGAELGRAENRHVRHRMFAILDRTNLSIASNVATLSSRVPEPSSQPQTILVSTLRDTTELAATGPTLNWEIKAGDALVVGVGANQEVVEVLDVTQRPAPAIRAIFTKAHPPGTPLALAQTPGAPPIFLKPIKVEGAAPTYTVTIPVNPDRSSAEEALSGEYDGIPWTIRVGTKLLIDVGADQEAVAVQAVEHQVGIGTFRIAVTRPHAGDFLITNTLLGNPGPRARFNPREPGAAAVVRYLSVIQ